ncbi:MAG: ArsA family ATPase [Desulfobacterales bacterium]|jgi:arsenite-transporting ATPase
MASELLFFIGKGGVGKSTSSALISVYLSETSHKTLLVSMDPAHNQRDIFERNFSEKPQKVSPNLMVKEVDTDFWIEKYLKETQRQIKETYRYESAFNLQNYFNVLQFSPGLEEYALLLAFDNIINKFKELDIIIFDMAPTALTLRFFSLPFITLIWLEELLKLRKEIYAKKEIISKIKIGKKELEQDKVKAKLKHLIDNYDQLRTHFLSDATRIHMVMNIDKLSFSETYRIRQKLKDIGMIIDSVIINKLKPDDNVDEIVNEFESQKIIKFPLSAKGITGLSAIKAYIGKNSEVFVSSLG